MSNLKKTHIRVKTGEEVSVSRQYGTLVVRNNRGKVLGSYEKERVALFQKRYKKKP